LNIERSTTEQTKRLILYLES